MDESQTGPEQGSDRRVRVLVVDDQRLMRDGIVSLLSLQDSIEVVATAGNGREAIEQAHASRPDLVLMDIRMPVMDGVAATAQLRRELPHCRILMLTTFDDEEYVVEALQAGAIGYLLKDIPAQDLASAVHAAYRGMYQLDPIVARKVVASLKAHEAPAPPLAARGDIGAATGETRHGGLSSREIEVLRLIAQGATNKEIAESLIISEGTVKNHISNILTRLGLRDRTQAAIYAREKGLL
ncbi:MAG: response regulator [Chloroflexia bacterium]